ncbi:MAG: diguanylate cyclase [Devosia sp.]
MSDGGGASEAGLSVMETDIPGDRLLQLARRAGHFALVMLVWPDPDGKYEIAHAGPMAPEDRELALTIRQSADAVPDNEMTALPTPSPQWHAFCSGPLEDRVVFLLRDRSDRSDVCPAHEVAGAVFDALGDVTDVRRVRSSLRRAKSVLRNVETMTGIGIWQVDLERNKLIWSAEVYRIHGIDTASRTPNIEEAIDFYPEEVQGLVRSHIAQAVDEQSGFSFTLPFRRADGEMRTVRCMGNVSSDRDGHHMYGIIQDVTDEKEAELRLWWTANHDSLTGLANRMLLQDRLTTALESARRHNQSVGLILVDVDHFKTINDVYGHEAGDELLKCIADRLKQSTRQGDSLARLGGDEFAIVVNNLTCAGDIERPLERLMEAAEIDFEYRDTAIPVHLSLGAAVFPRDALDESELYRNADLALFQTKRETHVRGTVYDPVHGVEQDDRHQLMQQIRGALEAKQIVPYYLPVFDLETGAVVSVEVLARWQHSEGVAEAGVFQAAFDDYALAPLIGIAVVDQLLEDWNRLRAATGTRLPVALNTSIIQLQNLGFVEHLDKVLTSEGMRASDMMLEMGKNPLAHLGRHVLPAFQSLLKRGLTVGFDSLSEGLATLATETELDVRLIKVDSGFLAGGSHMDRKSAVTAGVVQTCKTLNVDLVAGAVEHSEQVEVLAKLGLRLGQGYLFTEPMSFADFLDRMRSDRRWNNGRRFSVVA